MKETLHKRTVSTDEKGDQFISFGPVVPDAALTKNQSFENQENALAVNFGPVYDVRNDLSRLRGITGALAYLTSPVHLREDDEYEIFHEALMDIHERIDAACEQLSAAIKNTNLKEVRV